MFNTALIWSSHHWKCCINYIMLLWWIKLKLKLKLNTLYKTKLPNLFDQRPHFQIFTDMMVNPMIPSMQTFTQTFNLLGNLQKSAPFQWLLVKLLEGCFKVFFKFDHWCYIWKRGSAKDSYTNVSSRAKWSNNYSVGIIEVGIVYNYHPTVGFVPAGFPVLGKSTVRANKDKIWL